MNKTICLWCTFEFDKTKVIKNYKGEFNENWFCSSQCYYLARKEPVNITKNCSYCDKEFTTKLYNGYQYLRLCCCREHENLLEEMRIDSIGSCEEDEQRIA